MSIDTRMESNLSSTAELFLMMNPNRKNDPMVGMETTTKMNNKWNIDNPALNLGNNTVGRPDAKLTTKHAENTMKRPRPKIPYKPDDGLEINITNGKTKNIAERAHVKHVPVFVKTPANTERRSTRTEGLCDDDDDNDSATMGEKLFSCGELV